MRGDLNLRPNYIPASTSPVRDAVHLYQTMLCSIHGSKWGRGTFL